MIQIKISADHERLLKAATTEPELRGVVDMILEKVAAAHVTKALAKQAIVEPKEPNPYNWKEMVSALRDSLGPDELRVPPYPDAYWCGKIHRNARMYALDRPKIAQLCVKLKETYLKPPYSADFLISNYQRIIDGAFNSGTERKTGYTARRGPRLPKLPSD